MDYSSLIPAFFFIFGAIVGSFLNVVILRWNSGLSLGGRSRCFSCSKTLSWYELVPFLSFLFLRGKCSSCGAKISIQYFLVEALTGLMFLFSISFFPSVFGLYEIVSFLALLFIWSVLIVLAIYDLRHMILPDFFVFLFSISSVVFIGAQYMIGDFEINIWNLLAGPILFLFFFALWFVSGGRWMGFGDVKLAFGIGIFLGLQKGITAVALSFWIGAVVSLLIIFSQKLINFYGKSRLSLSTKPITMKSEIPFGPFLILGTILSFFIDFGFFGF